MEISLSSEKSLSHILKNYRGLDANLIVKTNILVNLSLNNGDRFASREQAKQILANIESFKHVTLDFRGIKSLGSAFVDEVFYVSKVKYPNLTIETVNTTDDIQFMIEHSIDT